MSISVLNKQITIWIGYYGEIVKKLGLTTYFADFKAIDGSRRQQMLSTTHFFRSLSYWMYLEDSFEFNKAIPEPVILENLTFWS